MTLDLFPYQRVGADYLYQHERCGLHDEMGIGKTATTIGAIDRLIREQGEVRGLVVCPAMLRQNWINEFAKFSTEQPRLVKGVTIHDFVNWMRGRYDILITSYEMATNWRKEFLKDPEFLDFIALDEAHFVKNYKAGRTRAMFGFNCRMTKCWAEWAIRVWHITGTPMSNEVLDVYPFLRLCGETHMTPASFSDAYFTKTPTPWGYKLETAKGVEGLLRGMLTRNRLARTLDEIGMELPPVMLTEMLVDGDTKQVIDLLREDPELENAILSALENGGLSQLNAHHIMTLRRLVGSAKAVPYAKILAEELSEGTAKRVVFCAHTAPALEVQKILEKAGIESVVVNGRTGEDERQEAVRRFQDPEDSLRVFIGNIKVAGTGLTLTASAHVDLLESDWTPSGNAQAIKRLHRYGQKSKKVWARFITLSKSIDERVNAAVRNKTADIAKVDGRQLIASIGHKKRSVC